MSFVNRELAARLEDAQAQRAIGYADGLHMLQPDPWNEKVEVDGAYVIYAGANAPVNRAFSLGMHQPPTLEGLQAIERFYDMRDQSPRIDLCPLANPALVPLLAKHGYVVDQFFQVFVCDLPCEEAGGADAGEEIRISQAEPDDAERWITTIAKGFQASDTPSGAIVGLLAPNFFASNATCYYAWIEAEPVGGGAMFLHHGIAEFGSDSTRPSFRQRGVQTALLRHRLDVAKQAACDHAIVLMSPGATTQRNVERLGFRLAYTKAIVTRR